MVGRWGGMEVEPLLPDLPGQANPLPRSECTQTHPGPKGRGIPHILRDGQDRDHTSATGLLVASGSHYPMALGRGSSKGGCRLVVSQAESYSCGWRA